MTASKKRPASERTEPILDIEPSGSGSALYRALARVLVRRELISEKVICDGRDCHIELAAG